MPLRSVEFCLNCLPLIRRRRTLITHYSFDIIHSKNGLILPSVDCINKKIMKGGDDKNLGTCQETVP